MEVIDNEKNTKEYSLRPFKCELNFLTRSEGSTILSQGQTVILAGLTGPKESKRQKMFFEKPNFEVNYRSKGGSVTSAERIKGCIVKSACEAALFPSLYARCDITLNIHEMQNRGSTESAAINAGCLTLLNSGLQLQCLVASVTAALMPNDEIILDPDLDQTEEAVAVLIIAVTNNNGSVVAMDLTCHKPMDFSKHKEMISAATAATKTIFDYYRTVVNKYSKSVLV